MKPSSTWLRRFYPLRSCREVTALLIAREDRPLLTSERLALHIHLPMCQACQAMQGQVLVMRQALDQWRHYSDVQA